MALVRNGWQLCKRLFRSSLKIGIIVFLLTIGFLLYVAVFAYYNYTHELMIWNARNSNTVSNDQAHKVPFSRQANQLWTWDYLSHLELHDLDLLDPDRGFSKHKSVDYWVFATGTKTNPWTDYISPIHLAGNGCGDSAESCESFDTAFRRLQSEASQQTAPDTQSKLRLLDCDESPNLCTMWTIMPPTLAHVRSIEPCRMDWDSLLFQICSVEWAYVLLPLTKMPYNRNIRIGHHVVPAFPSAYEQLRALVTYDQSWYAFPPHVNEVGIDVLEVQLDIRRTPRPAKKIEPGVKGSWINETVTAYTRSIAQKYVDRRSAVLGKARWSQATPAL